MLEKQKLSSILDSITNERMYGDQMLYLQAVILQTKDNFNTLAKFILIEQIRHIDTDKEKNKERLTQRENFWILTLDTVRPKGLNKERN